MAESFHCCSVSTLSDNTNNNKQFLLNIHGLADFYLPLLSIYRDVSNFIYPNNVLYYIYTSPILNTHTRSYKNVFQEYFFFIINSSRILKLVKFHSQCLISMFIVMDCAHCVQRKISKHAIHNSYVTQFS